MLTDIDFIIRTQENPEGLSELLFSIAEKAPGANVHIADCGAYLSRTFYRELGVELREAGLLNRLRYHHIGEGAEWSAVMRKMLQVTKRKYVLTLEDTMVFSDDTDIFGMVAVAENAMKKTRIGVVCGMTKAKEIPNASELMVDDISIKWGMSPTITKFALYHVDVFHYVQFQPTPNPFDSFYAKLTGKTEFKVLITESLIGNNNEKAEDKKPEGDGDGASTEQPVQGNDEGGNPESGSDSAPSGEAESEPNTSSRRRRSRSAA